jgi:hypothetical protein
LIYSAKKLISLPLVIGEVWGMRKRVVLPNHPERLKTQGNKSQSKTKYEEFTLVFLR